MESFVGLALPPVDVNGVGHGLESVEGDPYWQQESEGIDFGRGWEPQRHPGSATL